MRPPTTPQSAIRHPLTYLLGTEASVRILRILCLTDIPLGVAELARQAALQASGVQRVCQRLEDLGAIEAVGRGTRGRQFRLGQRFPLRSPLMSLFQAERGRADGVFSEIRNRVRMLAPQPRAAWIEGPVARGTDTPGTDIVVGVVVPADKVATVRDDLRRMLLDIQRQQEVVLDARVMSEADLEATDANQRAELEQVMLLHGPPPLDLRTRPADKARRRNATTHQQLDRRSRAYAVALAERIKRDPSIVEDALRWVERRLPGASGSERLELEEWHGVLSTMSASRLRRFLVQDNPRLARLRQSMPFAHVLTEQERTALTRRTVT